MALRGRDALVAAEKVGGPKCRKMVGAAQVAGFRTDVKLNRIAEELTRSLQVGCQL